MKVIGFDPEITVDAAWRLPSSVRKAHSIEDVLRHADFVTLHVPLLPVTQRLLEREVRPQRVDDALTVQPGARGEGEELDELGGLASVPVRPIDRRPVKEHGEPVEEPHADVHLTMLVSP